MTDKFTFHRHTIANSNSPYTIQEDILNLNHSLRRDLPKQIIVCKRFYPNDIRRNLTSKLDNPVVDTLIENSNSNPVVWEGVITEESYEILKDYIYLTLAVGRESYISNNSNVDTISSHIVVAATYTFEEFLKDYKGDLFLDMELLKQPEKFESIVNLKIFAYNESHYFYFLNRYFSRTLEIIYSYKNKESDEFKHLK